MEALPIYPPKKSKFQPMTPQADFSWGMGANILVKGWRLSEHVSVFCEAIKFQLSLPDPDIHLTITSLNSLIRLLSKVPTLFTENHLLSLDFPYVWLSQAQ